MHQSKHTLAISTSAVFLDWYFVTLIFLHISGLFKYTSLLGQAELKNAVQHKRACHSSISFGRVTSRPCRTQFLLLHWLARGFGKLAALPILGEAKE